MSSRGFGPVTGLALAGALSLSVTLAGCGKAGDDAGNTSAAALPALPATLPMTSAPAQPVALAPAPSAIPARTIRTVRVADPRAAYAYADQADYFSQSLGDGPPDYGFDYDGVSPWAWQGYDGSRVFVEPVDGGYRYYYYRTGADRPYFIRDPRYGYGYDGDQLAAIYGPDGALVPYGDYGSEAGYAAAYLWRAERLFEASRDRRAISAAAWADHEASIAASRDRWAANRDRQADWAAYHAEEAAQQSRYWAEEAERRDADAQRFAAWHQQDFRTPPPPRAIPPGWQQASWAQDGARYAPIAAAAAGAAALAVVAHDRQAAAARRDARPQEFATIARQQPVAPPPSPSGARGGPEARPGPADRAPPPPPSAAGTPPQRSWRTAAARDRGDAADRAFEPRREMAPAARDDMPARPEPRAAPQTVRVHEGSEAAPRASRPTPPVEMQRDRAPHERMAPSPPPPREAAPQPQRPPAAPPRVSQPAPQHGGGDRPGGGHPDGGHAGGGHDDRHR